MAATYTLIEAKTLASSAATVTFSSIPSTYTDLQLLCSLRTTRSAVEENFYIYFNTTDSGSAVVLRGNGSAADSYSAGDSFKGQLNASTSTANTFSNLSVYIPNYTSSNNKSLSLDIVTEQNGTTAYAQLVASLWSNTAAINAINFRLQFASFDTYSTFYLYGIKNS